jgi:hypothetical protein
VVQAEEHQEQLFQVQQVQEIVHQLVLLKEIMEEAEHLMRVNLEKELVVGELLL